MRVLVTADAGHPGDFCRLFLDRNRNGSFADDGPGTTSVPAVREKTGDTWVSFNKLEVTVPYGGGVTEPYMFNVWLVRSSGAAPPELLRVLGGLVAQRKRAGSRRRCPRRRDGQQQRRGLRRQGQLERARVVRHRRAEAGVVVHRSAIDQSAHVRRRRGQGARGGLPLDEPGRREIVFDRVEKPVTKAADRAGDDTVAAERSRPRASIPFRW